MYPKMMRGRCFGVLRNMGGGRKIRAIASPSLSLPTVSRDTDSPAEPNTSFGFTNNQYQKRWKHAGKMGHKVESLKEMAHQPEREAAQERRKKKKARKASKKGVTKGQSATKSENAVANDDGGVVDDDDIYFDDIDDDDYDLDDDGEPTLPDPDDVRGKMDAVIERFRDSLKSIRGAEPTADMFDDVMVQAYGSATPLNAVAQVVVTSPTLAQLTCFDPSLAKDVVKAIQLTLELNPQMEEGGGGNIKVPLPRVTIQVREKLSKSVKKRAESCKQRLRGVRRKAMDVVKKGKDGKLSGVSKDDAFASGKDIEAASEAALATLKTIVSEKMDSIMEV